MLRKALQPANSATGKLSNRRAQQPTGAASERKDPRKKQQPYGQKITTKCLLN